MHTEDMSPRYRDLDAWPVREMLAAMFEGQLAAVAAVGPALDAIAAAVEEAAPLLRRGGRLAYAGAGTSGRLGALDGTELAPTFDWPEEKLVFALAGGLRALSESVEGAEDDEAAGAAAIAGARIGADDVVIAIAASGATPFTLGALRAAGERGALTVAVANNGDAPLLAAARHRIVVETGPEAIAGSTRMKAGTAQKVVLNLFSTAVMARLGRVHGGRMVHMRASNAKLRRRAETMIGEILGCGAAEAAQLTEAAEGDVKLAVLLGRGLGAGEAAALLDRHAGNLRAALGEAFPHPGPTGQTETG
ncbi:MAG TPA: N-acetylmuramic acid 6-phosphate etherase [Mesorhizobium sp.]|jgi:N-acetylmuramic acid 6-phosphate etherase|nr:N-acetylmuramic acid 6-phosphate etherase [Mesorhizobium sp.]